MKKKRFHVSFILPLVFFILILLSTSNAIATNFRIFQIDNPNPSDGALFGFAVTGISDINGDGIKDFAVSARGADRVYVFSGADHSVIRVLEDPDGLSGYWFGYSVRGVGDINSDGVEDIAVGAPSVISTDPLPSPSPTLPDDPMTPEISAIFGRVFIFSGETGDMILRITNTTWDFPYAACLGSAIAPLGDINNDGIPDIGISAPSFEYTLLGYIYGFSGADGSLIWECVEPGSQGDPDHQWMPSLGLQMVAISDITNDGKPDLLVAAPWNTYEDPFPAGRAFVVNGVNGSIFRFHNNPDPPNGYFLGYGPSPLGSQDGGIVEDYAFGEAGVGKVYLFSGETGDSYLTFSSPNYPNNDFFGYKITKTDDKDDDGIVDFWVSAPYGGIVYLMNSYGAIIDQVDDPNPINNDWELAFGWSISATNDLDGDGRLDLIIGKPGESVGGHEEAGVIYLVTSNQPPVADAGTDRIKAVGATCTASVILDGSGSSDPDGDPLTYSWTWDGGSAIGVSPIIQLPLGNITITLIVNDGTVDSEPDTVVITVIDDLPPQIIAPSDIIVECESNNGQPVNIGNPNASDNCCEVNIENDAPLLFQLGDTIVTWTATDCHSNASMATQKVTIEDTTPPDITVSLSPAILWPPNHKMVEVVPSIQTNDICCGSNVIVDLVEVTMNESNIENTYDPNYDIDPESGYIGEDIQIVDGSIFLRAERTGKSDGRVYTITYKATDCAENSSTANGTVTVPHDQR